MEVFSNTGCSKCALLKKWLESEQIEYVERNVATDPSAMTILRENGFRSFPQVRINGEFVAIKDYDFSAIKEALEV